MSKSMELREDDLRSPAYDLLFRGSPRPAYVFDATTFGFLDVNDAALVLYGYDRASFLARTALEIRPAEEVPRLVRALREGTFEQTLWRHLRRDGRVLHVEAAARPVRWLGRDALVVSIQDVTAREEARRDLQMSEERFRLIFDASPVGIAAAGHDFRITEANPAFCRLVGYRLEDLRTMTFLDLTHPEDRLVDGEAARRLLEGEIPYYEIEKRYVTSAGPVVWVHVTAYATHDETGRVRFAMGLVEDITERKRRQAEVLAEAAAAIERLSTLTAREREILEHARTRTAREIAETFTISPRTAESHLASAYRKLQVTTRDAALREYDRLVAAASPLPVPDDRLRTGSP